MSLCRKYINFIALLSTIGLLYILYKAYARLDAANSIRSFPNAANGYTRSGYKVSVVVNYTLPRRLSAITNDTHCPDGFWKDDELTWENSTAIPTQIAEYEQFVKAKEWTSGKSDDLPVFITGASSNHFQEMIKMLHNFNDLRQRLNRNWMLYFFNLGLSVKEVEKVQKICNCTVKRFDFNRYPVHVKHLHGYAFKPLAIEIIARMHNFVVWMDASVRFKQSDFNILLDQGRKAGVFLTQGGGSVARRTLPSTFHYFNTYPCRFRSLPELQGGFLIFYMNPFIIHRIFWPWVRCALEFGCMVPDMNPEKYLACNRYGNVFGECHRFDQSAISILLYTVYGKHISEHTMHYSKNMYMSFH